MVDVVDTSGPTMVYGVVQRNAMEGTAAYVNKTGGILGHKVNVVVLNDNGDADTAISVVTNYLSTHPKPDMIFPGTSDIDAIGLLPLIKRDNLLAITTVDPNAVCYTEAASQCQSVFVPTDPEPVIMAAAVAWFKSHGYHKIGILSEQDALSGAENPTLDSALTAAGIQYATATFPPTAVNVEPEISQLQAAGAQAIYGEALGPAAGYIGVDRAQLGLVSKIPLMFDPGGASLDLTKLMPAAATKNAYEVCYGIEDPNQTWTARDLVVNYSKPFGGVTSQPLNLAALVWTDLLLARAAAEQANSIDETSLVKALNDLSQKGQDNSLYLSARRIKFTPDDHESTAFDSANASGRLNEFVVLPVGPLVGGMVASN